MPGEPSWPFPRGGNATANSHVSSKRSYPIFLTLILCGGNETVGRDGLRIASSFFSSQSLPIPYPSALMLQLIFMAYSVRQWRLHQNRWHRFHQWEEAQPPLTESATPSDRLRWCEEALALHQRFSPARSPTLDAEQIRHWQATRRRLPRHLPNHHGAA
jgi:hypothetical protein